jgi:hypothetical protein
MCLVMNADFGETVVHGPLFVSRGLEFTIRRKLRYTPARSFFSVENHLDDFEPTEDF